MPLTGTCTKRTFHFRFDARTSRGPIHDRSSWFVKIVDGNNPQRIGYGECGPLPGLSIDDTADLETAINQALQKLPSLTDVLVSNVFNKVRTLVPPQFPSVTFAFETALLDWLNGGRRIIFNNRFIQSQPIPINGLVWMGDAGSMMEQVHEKVKNGFTCIKIKVGGLDFDEECRLLEAIREKYSGKEITLRLDANGAFDPHEALDKLHILAQFNIHSIEQPVRPGVPEMKAICDQSPIPVALDEELIGREDEKGYLLEQLQPSYIILKPMLHGGLHNCQQWIKEAERLNIGWWITSALESNIGLNAICQFTATYDITLPQGLGTGALYTNNFKSPLMVSDGVIRYDPKGQWRIDV